MDHKETERQRISAKERLAVLKRDGFICGYCEVSKRRKLKSLVIDHIIPVKEGGHHGPENWVAACRSCNRIKWFYYPNDKTAPRLRWHSKKAVAKVTTKGIEFSKRIPIISYRRIPI